MSSENVAPTPYRVIWTGDAKRDASELRDQAIALGGDAAKHLAKHLRKIIEALTWIPTEWGEPFIELAYLEIQICIGFHEGLAVNYGIDAANHIVYVRQVRRM